MSALPKPTHENEALRGLRSISSPIEGVEATFVAFDEARLTLWFATELLEGMRATADLILAAEALEEKAALLRQKARAALAEAMSLGATQFKTEAHVVSLKEGTRGVVITDEAAIPRELWSTPEPKPDKTEIGKRLRRGERIAGAELANFISTVVQIKKRDAA